MGIERGNNMKVIFKADPEMEKNTVKVTTHPVGQEAWGSLENAIANAEQKLVVINAANGRNVHIPLHSIAAVQSEDRMCNIQSVTGERYLYNQRLKVFEQRLGTSQFIKINNQTLINTRLIQEFSSADHARIKVILSGGSSFYVSRFYIKQFKERL